MPCALAQSTSPAQTEGPGDYLQITTGSADTFNENGVQIVVIDNPVTLETDHAKFSGKSAVLWISKLEGTALNRQRVDIALVGDASLTQGDIVRSGEKLFVTTMIDGPVRLTAEQRRVRDPRGSDLYKSALDMRPFTAGIAQPDKWLVAEPIITPAAETPPSTQPTVFLKTPISFTARDIQTTTQTPDHHIAAVLRGGVLIIERNASGEVVELQADQAVLYTTLTDLKDIQGAPASALQDKITAAYIEGDVRITVTPAPRNRKAAEQRLRAQSAYYEFATHRAVLTQAVLHTTDPTNTIPVIVRANTVKQLSDGE